MSLERFFDSNGFYRPIHSAPLWYSSRPVELPKAERQALVGILADAGKRIAEPRRPYVDLESLRTFVIPDAESLIDTEPRTYSEAEVLASAGLE